MTDQDKCPVCGLIDCDNFPPDFDIWEAYIRIHKMAIEQAKLLDDYVEETSELLKEIERLEGENKDLWKQLRWWKKEFGSEGAENLNTEPVVCKECGDELTIQSRAIFCDNIKCKKWDMDLLFLMPEV